MIAVQRDQTDKGESMRVENSLSVTYPKIKNRYMTNRFVGKTLHHDEVIIDRKTKLMWQQSASLQPMVYHLATAWIDHLNQSGFAGFNDWRLPTLEESMTLMEQSPNSEGLYIDPIFNSKSRFWMWTSEKGSAAGTIWYVNFNYGYSQQNRIKSSHNYVRAVRLRR